MKIGRNFRIWPIVTLMALMLLYLPVVFAGTASAAPTPAPTPAPVVSPVVTPVSTATSCATTGFSLSWVLCPVIDGLAHLTNDIYTQVAHPLLNAQSIDVTNGGTDPSHTYEIWSEFRIYGDVFLVIALLVVVFGESIGGGLIDAYAAKKNIATATNSNSINKLVTVHRCFSSRRCKCNGYRVRFTYRSTI
jgi:hypothetical protein